MAELVQSVKILGHQEQRQAMDRLFRANRLPTAIMLAGPRGVGKRLIAAELAHTVLCEQHRFGGCGECRSCVLCRHGNHPDFITVHAAQKNEAAVENIRTLLASLQLRSFLGGARVVVIDDADEISIQGANLLLKHIEEPRPGTHFILVVAHALSLPITVRSRCQAWFFDRLSAADVAEYLRSAPASFVEGLTEEQLQLCAVIADGSLERIAEQREDLALWQELRAELRSVSAGDFISGFRALVARTKDKEGLPRLLAGLRTVARTELNEAAHGPGRARWALFLQNVIEAERLLFERHLAPAAVMHYMLVGLCPDARVAGDPTIGGSALLLESVSLL